MRERLKNRKITVQEKRKNNEEKETEKEIGEVGGKEKVKKTEKEIERKQNDSE